VPYLNLPIIEDLKHIFKLKTNKDLAFKLSLSEPHLSRINNETVEIPYWFHLIVEVARTDMEKAADKAVSDFGEHV